MRRALVCGLTLTALVAGCERTDTKPAAQAMVSGSAPSADSGMAPVAASGWREADGPFFIVAGDAPTTGSLILPDQRDTTALSIPGVLKFDDHPTLELFGRAGIIGRARFTRAVVSADTGCDAWPTAHVAPLTPAGDSARWSVAFVEHVAQALAVDSIEQLSRADSGRLVAELARLASGLPNDTVATFRGIPFNVHGAWRFAVDGGVVGVVAEITRRVAQEANQREERLLIIAERDTAPASRWVASYTVRVAGTEETVDALDMLTVVRLGSAARVVIVVRHESTHGTWYELIERTGAGQWRRQWRSPPSGC